MSQNPTQGPGDSESFFEFKIESQTYAIFWLRSERKHPALYRLTDDEIGWVSVANFKSYDEAVRFNRFLDEMTKVKRWERRNEDDYWGPG